MSASDSGALAVQRLFGQLDSVHAVLFYGPSAQAVDRRADELAAAWLCLSSGPGGACGECQACRSVAANRAVDMLVVEPWGPQALIKLDAMRPPPPGKPEDPDAPKPSLLEYVRTRPLMSARKVVVYRRAERMNNAAANALLKTLEEPPPYAKVILTSVDFGRILPTVRSRCMCVCCSAQPETAGADDPGFLALAEILESVQDAPPGAALAVAERCREAAEKHAKAAGVSPRAAQGEIMARTAQWLLANRPHEPQLAQAAVDAHRLVLGNMNAGPLFDSLWARVLVKSPDGAQW